MRKEKAILRSMTFGAYDLQMLRIQTGLRLCANFRSQLTEDPKEDDETGDLSTEAKTIIERLKESYKRLTDGVARNRTLPKREGFTGDELISNYTELVLVDQYIKLEKQERAQFAQLETALVDLPIYNEYLSKVNGIGPALASVLICYFDPHAAPYISSFWMYAGLDVAEDGRGRSKRAEHLIDREYKNRDGEIAIRKSLTYNPWLKSRLLAVLGTSFLRTVPVSPWKKVYNDYKHRLETDPKRVRCTSDQYKKTHKRDPEEAIILWPPLRIHRASVRYMIKQFLLEFWVTWRRLEGLPVTETYAVAKLGMAPHGSRYENPGDQPIA
jgi:hypothetical protein